DLRIRPAGTIVALDAVGNPPAVRRHLHVADQFQPVEIATLEYRRSRRSRRRLPRLRDPRRILAVDHEHSRSKHDSEHGEHRASHRDRPGDTTLLHTKASSTPNIDQWPETIPALAGVCTLRAPRSRYVQFPRTQPYDAVCQRAREFSAETRGSGTSSHRMRRLALFLEAERALVKVTSDSRPPRRV